MQSVRNFFVEHRPDGRDLGMVGLGMILGTVAVVLLTPGCPGFVPPSGDNIPYSVEGGPETALFLNRIGECMSKSALDAFGWCAAPVTVGSQRVVQVCVATAQSVFNTCFSPCG